jgi:hypothetical protein
MRDDHATPDRIGGRLAGVGSSEGCQPARTTTDPREAVVVVVVHEEPITVYTT